jgi:hypothetical protein
MLPGPETTKVVREGVERACKEFTSRISPLGFARAKRMFWTRLKEFTVDVIHFHRQGSTYGSAINYKVEFRVHFAIRLLADPAEHVALNGPFSDPARLREGRFHLSFNASSGHMYDRCVEDLTRFVTVVGEPWFFRFADMDALQSATESPLNDFEKQALTASLANAADPTMTPQTANALRIKTAP